MIYEKEKYTKEQYLKLRDKWVNKQIDDDYGLSTICNVYYDNDEYISKKGLVSKINFDGRVLQIVKDKIKFDDIYLLNIVEI